MAGSDDDAEVNVGRLGELEQLLLLALLRLGGDASGIELRDEVASRTGRSVLPGAVYTVMERMSARGLVSSYTGATTPERGGRRRKHYRLTPAGERDLAYSWDQVRRMSKGLGGRLGRTLEES